MIWKAEKGEMKQRLQYAKVKLNLVNGRVEVREFDSLGT
jgi:hypothetical protein